MEDIEVRLPAPVADAPVELMMGVGSSQGVRDTIDGLSDSHNETPAETRPLLTVSNDQAATAV